MHNVIHQNAFRYSRSVRWLLAFIVIATTVSFYVFDAFERLELLTLDYRFILRKPKPISSDIVFIDMAEDSIEAVGRWPWPRKWHATILKVLSGYHPRLIAFDVLFTESQDETDDMSFEEAMRQAGCVYLPLLFNLKEQDAKYLTAPDDILSVVEPLERFRIFQKGTGHLNAIPDPDGVLRRIPAFLEYQGKKIYQFGLQIGRDTAASSKKIPLDKNNQMLINWRSRWGKEGRHYSYIDVLKSYVAMVNGNTPLIDLNEFKDKICIIGLTAAGLIDIKPIPLEKAYPAVGINATIINSVLRGDFLYETPKWLNILIIILLTIFISLFLSNVRLLGGILLAVISMFGYCIFSIVLFDFFNVVVLTFYPLIAIFLSYSFASIYAQVMQTIERSRLFKQATRDELTGLYNIRHFNLLLEREFRAALIYKSRRLAVIMADIDNFKHANDTYGHPAGDAILKETARVVRTRCRQTDIAARYGGEEFIVMLPGAGEKEAYDVAEKIRAAVAKEKFTFNDEMYSTTISLGVAQFSGQRNKEELISMADKALYRAKHEGKDRVCLYSGGEPCP